MDRDYYKAYYHYERNHWWFKVRNRILMDQVNNVYRRNHFLNPAILNVGVATGKTSQDLEAFGNVTSVEYDEETCDFLKKELGWEVINASVLKLPFNNDQFDIVCAFDVIEHVEDDMKAISELKRVCKKGGAIVLSVPMFMMLWSDHDIVNHHYRRYTLSRLSQLFIQDRIKGKTLKKSYFNTILFLPILVFRIVEKLFKSKEKEARSDFAKSGNPVLGKILYFIFLIEYFALKKIKLPFGISGFIVWKKDDE